MMPIIRGSYLVLRIGFAHPLAPLAAKCFLANSPNMMPIIRGSYLALRIGFTHPLAPNAPFPVATHPLAPIWPLCARLHIYCIISSTWPLPGGNSPSSAICRLICATRKKCVVARRPFKNPS